MFTGLVQGIGTVTRCLHGERAMHFRITGTLAPADLSIGASVAIDGVCLTVTHADGVDFDVTAAFETLAVTTLGQLREGDTVNLEPALRHGDALGGHFVTGHVDAVGKVRSLIAEGEATRVFFDAPSQLHPFIARKGSIAVQGVSLTVNDVDAAGFTVGLIPHTLQVTTLGRLCPGARVNLEVDLLARYAARRAEFPVHDGSGGQT